MADGPHGSSLQAVLLAGCYHSLHDPQLVQIAGFGHGIFQYGLFNGGALRAINGAAFLADGAAAPMKAMFGTMAGGGTMFDATSPALYGIATLASIILLFLSGLETNLKMFIKYSFVGLMVGIGILFLAVTNASVKEVLNPLLLAIVPTSRVPYIIFFAILAPLALYRGPMNMFGLGSGIAALIIGLGTLNPLAVMAAFLAAERIQCGGDPTNTQNVWTANFCEVDVNTCTKKMLPYLWAVSIVGVILGAMLYF